MGSDSPLEVPYHFGAESCQEEWVRLLGAVDPDEHVHERSFVLRKQKFDWEWQFSLPTRSAQTLHAHLPRVRRLLHIMQAVCDLHDVQQDDKLAGQASLYAVQANTKAIGTTQAQVVDQPKVNTKASTPASRNSISNCRSAMGFGCRIN
jgi:hypothetical protein